MEKQALIGKSLMTMKKYLESRGAPFERTFIYKQLHDNIFKRGIWNFIEMTDLSMTNRQWLIENENIGIPRLVKHQISRDGTVKWGLNFDPKTRNYLVESVFIPNVNRNRIDTLASVGTVCVSSQIGCSLKCSFCRTGSQKLLKNLTFEEIVAQVMLALKPDFPLVKTKPRKLTNIVFMGQGEPLLNFRNVAKAVKFYNQVFNFSPSRTTISTSGIVPLMRAVGNELGAGLAVSLHAVNNDLRNELVPINKTYPIDLLMDGCKQYLDGIKDRTRFQKRITFEYVMLEGVNDSLRDAVMLKRLISQIPAHVNLIPFNEWPGSNYKSSTTPQIMAFQNVLKQAGIPCHIRFSRGNDILAACGQLASSGEQKKSYTA